MRVHASVGALASLAWLSSAAAVPRAEDWALTDTTCTTTTSGQATVIVLPGESAASYTLPSVFTFTLPADGGAGSGSLVSSGLANGPSFASSTCESSETPVVPAIPTPSAPVISTVTVPVLTVTLPSPPLSSTGSDATPVATATVPGEAASNSVGVVTVTIPEGPSDTATVVLTVTVPQGSGSPGAWSTIITAPAVSGAPAGPLVTVTIFTSPASAAPGSPTTSIDWWGSDSTAFVTIPLDTGYGSDISLAPYTLTYTLPVAPGLTDLSIATVTVTPADLSIPTGVGPFATETLSSGVSSWSYVPAPPGTSVVSFTVSASGTVPGYTGVITVTPGMSWGLPTPVSVSGDQSGTATPTAPALVTVTVTSPSQLPTPSSGFATPSVVTVTPSLGLPAPSIVTVTPSVITTTPYVITATPSSGLPTPSIVAVTYTVPASLGLPASEYTVTYTVSPEGYNGGGPSTVSVPAPWTFTIVPTGDSGTPIVVTWPSEQPGPVTVTVTPPTSQVVATVAPSASQTIVTVTPGVEPASPGLVVTTITPLSGTPVVITLPDTGTPLAPATSAWTTQAFITETIVSNSVVTVTPPSGPPVVVTIPQSVAFTVPTGVSGFPPGTTQAFVTETIASDSVITVTPPSGPPVVVTIPESIAFTVPTGTPPFSAGLSSSTSGTVPPQTVIVSQVTISQTISLGPGSSTVVAVTTQVTLPADSTSTLSESGVLVTPSLATYTIADSYGNPTILTQWTVVPVSPSSSSAGGGGGNGVDGTLSSPTGTVQFITISPIAPTSVITILPSVAPSVITIWPSTDSFLTSFVSSTLEVQSGSASPSEITLWPLPTSTDTTCTTFSTGHGSPTISGLGSATSPSSLSVITLWPSTASPPYSVITIWPSSGDSALAGWPTTSTCNESPAILTSVILLSSVSTPFTPFGTPAISQSSDSAVVVAPTETGQTLGSQGLDTSAGALPESTELPASQPENTESPPSQPENTEAPANESEDLMPPPQTQFNRHGQHARTTTLAVLSDSTFGGYAFSSPAAGYGDLPPGYGNPVETAPASSSQGIFFTDSSLPVSQPASADISFTASVLPISTTSTADLAAMLSSIMSVLSPNATIVSRPGPVLTSIPAASDNSTSSTQPSLTSTTYASSSSDLLLTSDSIVPTVTALPTTASSLLANISSLTAAPIATSLASTSPNVSTSSRGLPGSTCGAVGDRGAVVFKFDDIPTISTDNDTEASSFPAMPLPFPYHRFFFSNGFSVVPPPRTKFKASSGQQLIQHNSSVSPVAEFGLAELRSNPCFHFSFLGVSLGCDSTSDPCVFNMTGLRWNGTDDVVEARHTFEVAACSKKTDCSLSHQILDSAAALPFSNLTSLNISLSVAGKPETWWADDLQIAWADNDCTVAACRSRVPNTIMIPRISQPFASRAKRLLRWAVRGKDDKFY
uniref:DUF7371 domain-containing protein n=1 Tax=Podospora anserina (strain S / ATCC MYA-4624 / DSM 980 / FGSC 10383) TaxID=515849 RepID=A0A090CTW3_PODAN|nr:Putative protein of unknown function [Podospora anserina S mat+]